jgi:NADPH:quinone reductase-like Zn-dependent oxidoreductase
MRAVQLTAFGNPVDGLECVDIPEPDTPGPNQVLIGAEYSPINAAGIRPSGKNHPVCPLANSTGSSPRAAAV